MGAGWPLVGRDQELAFLLRVYEAGDASGVVMSGAPGVGKSRLAAEFLEAVAEANPTHAVVATPAMSDVAFGAFVHLLRDVNPGGATLPTLVDRLAQRGEGRRVVLAVDDAHLLDTASAGLVHQAAVHGVAFVVATVRSGPRPPEPIVALWKDRLAERLELQPLADAEAEELIGAALAGEVDRLTLHALVSSSAGNVLMLRELVESSLRSGALALKDGMWRWTGGRPPSERLSDVVALRLGQLADDERATVEVVALAEPVELAVLAQVAEPATIAGLERRAVIVITEEGRRRIVRLGHPLYGEVIRAALPRSVVGGVHSRLADAVARRGTWRTGDGIRVALWRLDAGTSSSADELMVAARGAFPLWPAVTQRLAQAALDGGAGPEAQELMARALAAQGAMDEAERYLGELEAVASPERLGPLAALRAEIVFAQTGETRAAAAVADAARKAAPDGNDDLLALQATFAFLEGRVADAIATTDPVRLRPDLTGESLRALIVAAPVLTLAGRFEEAMATADRGRQLAQAGGHAITFTYMLDATEAMALRWAGDMDEAERVAAAGHTAAVIEKARDALAMWAVLLGQFALTRGRLRTASRWFREGIAPCRDVDTLVRLPWCLAGLATALAQSGNVAEARAALEEAERTRSWSAQIVDADLGQARAWVARAEGRTSEAAQIAVEAGRQALTAGQLLYAADCFHDAARLGSARSVAADLATLAARVEGRLIPTFAAHAAALATRRVADLEAVAARFADMGLYLFAHEAWRESARSHRDAGSAGAARRADANAAVAAGRCEGLLVEQAPPPEWLSSRELEVGHLAARGLSNREIADALFLSVRTVENHLHRVYAKLGVTRRHELVALLDPPA